MPRYHHFPNLSLEPTQFIRGETSACEIEKHANNSLCLSSSSGVAFGFQLLFQAINGPVCFISLLIYFLFLYKIMDVRWEKTLRDQDHRNRHNPSFSSTLLDAIYRSIDEPVASNNKRDHENMSLYKETMTRKKHFMEEKNASSEKVGFRRKNMADLDKKVQRRRDLESVLLNLSTTSSDSSYGGGFSSSESESFSRPKAIRTSVSSSSKTKSKPLKSYGDLNNVVKKPISPCGRLASFLNSIFTAGNAKKAKIRSKSSDKASLSSTCSSASSFSRSCLINTPSLRGINGIKRSSVRFSPASVIVDEECSGGGGALMAVVKKNNSTINEEFRLHIMSENRRVEEVARDLLKNYRKIDDEDEDDAASDSSSDLFELDNLSVIGIDRYQEELPVYGTTHLDTNPELLLMV
ncbi:hypothetical protein HS088_TW02G00253 [Tripterygium wilfordii]|uniref:Protein BIG GRAIN 1-like B n=1 Tax=Tripterygium wilfordii TaxID=458696 RepID=A0A7J7DY51_TRIWF|nr:protein BIG GRAIN 1-like A [Tripterygium wilfordii]KAF5751243.1 hypothetical protein HS088_TW02G00253 [Tripterygium wilfordii]